MNIAKLVPERDESTTVEKLHSFRVLVVDDNEASAKTIMWIMEMLGHTAKVAYDGPSAITLATSFIPDIIFLDIGLPVMNGYEICKAMRNEPVLQNTIFVAQTGWGQKEHQERSKKTGFDHHLVKPLNIETIENILSALDKVIP